MKRPPRLIGSGKRRRGGDCNHHEGISYTDADVRMLLVRYADTFVERRGDCGTVRGERPGDVARTLMGVHIHGGA